MSVNVSVFMLMLSKALLGTLAKAASSVAVIASESTASLIVPPGSQRHWETGQSS